MARRFNLVVFGFSLILAGILAGHGASAAPLDALSAKRVRTIKTILSRIKIDASLRRNVPLARAADVERAANDADQKLTQARREYKKIPMRNHNHPDVVAVVNQMDRVQAYIDDLQRVMARHQQAAAKQQAAQRARQQAATQRAQAAAAKQQAAQAAQQAAISKQLESFSNDYWKYKERLDWMKPFYDDPNLVRRWGDTTIDEAKAAFADIHAGCTGKYADIADPSKSWNEHYRWWCDISAHGDEILKRMVSNWAKDRARLLVDSFKKEQANLASCNPKLKDWNQDYYLDPEKVKNESFGWIRADAKKVGVELSADIFADADAALAALLPKIEACSKGWKFDPYYGKPTHDSWVKRHYEKFLPGVKVLKLYTRTKSWKVYRNSRGVNQYRTWQGTALLKRKGENWCREDRFAIVEDAKGRRSFGNRHFDHAPALGYTHIVSCK